MRYVIEYQSNTITGLWERSGNYLSTDPLETRRHLYDVEFPSLEAAQREAAIQQSRGSMLYRARDTQPELATQGGDMPVIATPARAVRIYRRNREWVVDTSGRNQPNMRNLTPYLPQTARETARNCIYVSDALAYGMNPQLLASAISAYYVEHPNVGETVAQEGISEMPDANAYVAWGDFIYKMIPVRQVSSSKAIRVMREKVRRDVESVRVSLTQQASQEAASIIAQANQRAGTIRAEAQRELDAANNSPKFPPWTLGYSVRMDGDRNIYLLKQVSFSIKELSHGVLRWKAEEAPAFNVWLWLPLDGKAEKVSMLDTSKGSLPHISSSACMKIGEAVQPILNAGSLERFAAQVSRVHSEINLASLLTANYTKWLPEAQRALPDGIRAWLAVHCTSHVDQAAHPEGLPEPDYRERGTETWSTL